jgi:hypothetical protein
MAADNYTEIAETMAEQDGGMSEFSYNPQTRRVEVETAEGRELYMSAGEIGMYGDDEFTQEDLQRESVQEAMDSIQELYMWADGMEYLEEVTGEEVQAFTGDELEPGNVETDGSVTMEDGKTNYAATERAV